MKLMIMSFQSNSYNSVLSDPSSSVSGGDALPLEGLTYNLKNQIDDKEKLGGKLSDEEKSTIGNAVDEKIKWLDSNRDASVEEMKSQKKNTICINFKCDFDLRYASFCWWNASQVELSKHMIVF
jgi:hypothetical protein